MEKQVFCCFCHSQALRLQALVTHAFTSGSWKKRKGGCLLADHSVCQTMGAYTPAGDGRTSQGSCHPTAILNPGASSPTSNGSESHSAHNLVSFHSFEVSANRKSLFFFGGGGFGLAWFTLLTPVRWRCGTRRRRRACAQWCGAACVSPRLKGRMRAVRANTASRPTESFCFPFSIFFNKGKKKKKG